MKCLTIVPYPNHQPENGLAILMAAHLNDIGVKSSWVRCNGVLSTCDKFEKRTVLSCQKCMTESRANAQWAGVSIEDLSKHISPADAVESHRWALSLKASDIAEARFQKMPLFPLCEDSIRSSLGLERVAPGEGLKAVSGEQMARQVLLQGARAEMALSGLFTVNKPDLVITTSGSDYFSRIIQVAALNSGAKVCVLQYESMHHMIGVRSFPSGAVRLSPLIFEDVLTLRRESSRWPLEVRRELDEMLIFLEIEKPQLSFAFSRAG